MGEELVAGPDPCLQRPTRREQLLCMFSRHRGCTENPPGGYRLGADDPYDAWLSATTGHTKFIARPTEIDFSDWYPNGKPGPLQDTIRPSDAGKQCAATLLQGSWTNVDNDQVSLQIEGAVLRFYARDQVCIAANKKTVEQLRAFATDLLLDKSEVLHELSPPDCEDVLMATARLPEVHQGEGPCEWFVDQPVEVLQDGGKTETYVDRCNIFVEWRAAGRETPRTNLDDFMQLLLTFETCIPGAKEMGLAGQDDPRVANVRLGFLFSGPKVKADFHTPPAH